MKKKRTRTNWSKIENHLNSLGIPSPRQWAKVRVVRRFISKNRMVEYDTDKAPYELTIEEFVSANAKQMLTDTDYSSARGAELLLKSRYIGIIIKAVKDDLDGVHPEGLELIRFRAEYMDLVRRYCRARKIILD